MMQRKFSASEIAEIFGFSPSRLKMWRARGISTTGETEGGRYEYSYLDALKIGCAVEISDSGFPLSTAFGIVERGRAHEALAAAVVEYRENPDAFLFVTMDPTRKGEWRSYSISEWPSTIEGLDQAFREIAPSAVAFEERRIFNLSAIARRTMAKIIYFAKGQQ